MKKIKRNCKANRVKVNGAEGGTRTHTPFAGKRILSPPRLPFRHLGLMIDSSTRRRADSNRRIGVLQTPALTSWLRRHNYQIYWSGRRDSNPRPLPWQGSILPLNYFRFEQILPPFSGSRKLVSWFSTLLTPLFCDCEEPRFIGATKQSLSEVSRRDSSRLQLHNGIATPRQESGLAMTRKAIIRCCKHTKCHPSM